MDELNWTKSDQSCSLLISWGNSRVGHNLALLGSWVHEVKLHMEVRQVYSVGTALSHQGQTGSGPILFSLVLCSLCSWWTLKGPAPGWYSIFASPDEMSCWILFLSINIFIFDLSPTPHPGVSLSWEILPGSSALDTIDTTIIGELTHLHHINVAILQRKRDTNHNSPTTSRSFSISGSSPGPWTTKIFLTLSGKELIDSWFFLG